MASSVGKPDWVRELSDTQAQVYELDGKSWDAFNPYGSTENVNIAHRSVEVTQTPFSYLFPAHTVTVLEVNGSSVAIH